jgi:two-component system heavy metal sensor histidine kinase CusS
VISLLIVLIIRIAVRQGHLPLRNVSNAIKNITSENLDARLEPTRVPIELEQLVISFNHMIERLRMSLPARPISLPISRMRSERPSPIW